MTFFRFFRFFRMSPFGRSLETRQTFFRFFRFFRLFRTSHQDAAHNANDLFSLFSLFSHVPIRTQSGTRQTFFRFFRLFRTSHQDAARSTTGLSAYFASDLDCRLADNLAGDDLVGRGREAVPRRRSQPRRYRGQAIRLEVGSEAKTNLATAPVFASCQEIMSEGEQRKRGAALRTRAAGHCFRGPALRGHGLPCEGYRSDSGPLGLVFASQADINPASGIGCAESAESAESLTSPSMVRRDNLRNKRNKRKKSLWGGFSRNQRHLN
jgi:hypothetical protein